MGLAGCGDDPFAFRWSGVPDTVVLYSLARPELNLSSGFDFFTSSSVRVEAATSSGNWDVALDTRAGGLVFLPPGALGVDSRARIATLDGQSFDDVIEAPTDTAAYERFDAVPIRLGVTYIVQTGQNIGAFGTRCVYYAKVEPLVIDVPGGALTFRDITNPVCNDPKLIPPN